MLVLGLFPLSVRAEEVYALGGMRQNSNTDDTTYTWQIEYLQRFDEHFGWSFSYLNEGHVPNHHRDGPVSQLWAGMNLLQNRLSLAAGLGVYRYFDTAAEKNGTYADDHGWGAVSSLAATWHVDGPWLVQLRGNWVHSERDVDNISALLGVGCELDAPSDSKKPYVTDGPTNNEFILFLGQSATNSFNSDQSVAGILEYRRKLSSFLELTASGVYEGSDGVGVRRGLMTQLWAVRPFFGERLTLGIGGGPYFVIDAHHFHNEETLAGMFGLTASYKLQPHCILRLTWNRVATNDNSDGDIILVGVGYLF
jgi:hypothetical protein